jgi:hypothetical protein
MSIWFLLGLGIAGFVAVLLLGWLNRSANSASQKASALAGHFRRLGRIAPAADCPCGSKKTYLECCREKDVALLKEDIVDYLWKPWAQKSYAGRRRSSNMGSRLDEHPLPTVVLPEWVEFPGRYKFPIDDETLTQWRPTKGGVMPYAKNDDPDSLL